MNWFPRSISMESKVGKGHRGGAIMIHGFSVWKGSVQKEESGEEWIRLMNG